MTIHELTDLATRLISIANGAETLAMTPGEIIQEVRYLAGQLRRQADDLDLEMDRVFLQEYA